MRKVRVFTLMAVLGLAAEIALLVWRNEIAVLPLALVWVCLLGVINLKYEGAYALSYNGRFEKELPGDYPPAEMSYLMTMRRMNARDLWAGFFRLYSMGLLSVVKEGGNYLFSLRPDAGQNPAWARLAGYERYAVAWLIEDLGGGTLTLAALYGVGKDKKQVAAQRRNYLCWKKLVAEAAAQQDFFEKKYLPSAAGLCVGFLYMAGGLAGILLTGKLAFGLLLIMGSFLALYSVFVLRRSRAGQEAYERWLAVKRYLMAADAEAEALSPGQWEAFLPYAISFGIMGLVGERLAALPAEAVPADCPLLRFCAAPENKVCFDALERVLLFLR